MRPDYLLYAYITLGVGVDDFVLALIPHVCISTRISSYVVANLLYNAAIS